LKKIISTENFEQGLAFAHNHAKGNVDAQVFLDFGEWLENINFKQEDDAEFLGMYFPNHLFEEPDEDGIAEFFETFLENPDFRLHKFDFDKKISVEERKKYREYFIDRAFEGGDYPAVVVSEISDGERSIFYFGTVKGYSFEGIETEDLGVFPSVEIGKKNLFPDGEFVGDVT